MNQIASWWDGLELWLSGLPYVPQLLLVIVIALPVAFGLARVFDMAIAGVFALVERKRVPVRATAPVPVAVDR